MQAPKPSPEAGALFAALAKTGYFFPFIKVIEIITGVLLLSNKFVAFALVLFTPILMGIAQINFILNPSGIILTAFLIVLYLFLAFEHKEQYKPLFK